MEEWFASWFDTRYYHILYKSRNYSEAEEFIRNLLGFLTPDSQSSILDLACGKGRHAFYVNSLGYNTTGVDLSGASIQEAKKMEKEGLHFFKHDMRQPILNKKYDFVFNLFTSFGYFDFAEENEKVLKSVHSYLEENGKLVIDFMNVDHVIENLVEQEIKEIEGIQFNISKKIENGFIVKDIAFEDDRSYHFQEKVQAIRLSNFEKFLTKTGFQIENIFGNYQLDPFTEKSDRLIIIAKKIS